MRLAVTVARRAGQAKADVLNTPSYRELLVWVKKRRARNT